MRHTYYWTCPHCGANLDPGEKCDCQESENEKSCRRGGGPGSSCVLRSTRTHTNIIAYRGRDVKCCNGQRQSSGPCARLTLR